MGDLVALSLRVATVVTAVSLPPAVATGYLLARHRFRGRALVQALVSLPMVMPPVAVGLLLLYLLGANGPLGFFWRATGIELVFSWWAAAIAAAVVGFPLLVRAIRQSAEAIDPRYARAARSLGASEPRIFFTVTLPLMAPGILTGITLAFARAVGEFGATITLAGNIPGRTQTLPLALFTVTQSPGGDAAALRLCILSLALAGGALLLSEHIHRRVPQGAHA